MKWRGIHGASDMLECDAFTQLACEVGFGRLRSVCVISVRAGSAALARLPMSREGGFQHIGNELKRGYIRPKWFEWFRCGNLKPLHEFAVPPENTAVAWTGNERKRSFWMFIN